MAKWGEGDPRWIVEERPDATNVNNWHWTEKNACAWSVDKLKELLVNLPMESDIAKCKVTEIEKCEGEAVVNNRKGKLIFFYEWDLKIKWKGSLKDEDEKEIEGSAHIPNLSEENDVSDLDVTISVNESNPTADILKDFMHRHGKEVIAQQLGNYVIALKEVHPTKIRTWISSSVELNATSASANYATEVQMQTNNRPSNNATSSNLYTTTLNLGHNFQCTAEEFYNAMTVLELVQAFTRGPVKLEAEVGGKFELFGGNIHGDFVELVPNKKIVQRWRSKRWPAEHYSIVTFTIEQKDDHTEVRVLQIGVPQSEADSTRENWEYYYWDSVKRTFGFGSFIV
uniref:Activator of Hsp90 ATPase AHSA1-like N-terminal domain-containing protein n=1 Tax=Timema genevievae TaxID=629358 RepID=A0A7R9PLB0_TIMGE|nr:unnamed protein product [Timema genevievae]